MAAIAMPVLLRPPSCSGSSPTGDVVKTPPPNMLKATEAATKLRFHSENHEPPPPTPPSLLPLGSESDIVPKLRWRRRRGDRAVPAAQDAVAACRVEADDSKVLSLVLWNEDGASWNAWACRAKSRSAQELAVARERDMASGGAFTSQWNQHAE